MIHYQRLDQIRERLDDIFFELECGFSAEVETNLMAEQAELEEERGRLEREADEYRDGYSAGIDFHLGSGRPAHDYDGKSRFWHQGFDQAGQDS